MELENIFFNFNLNAPPGYKIIKGRQRFLYENITKNRTIRFQQRETNIDNSSYQDCTCKVFFSYINNGFQ